MWRLPAVAAIVLGSASGACTPLLGPGGTGESSRAAEPPSSWESAILFQFRDSLSDPRVDFAARVEVDRDGAARRTITGRDVYLTESSFLRTPWYRLGAPGQIALRVVLEHAGGGRTVAEYPLAVRRDEFYYVLFGVGTRQSPEPHRPELVRELRTYALAENTGRQASDSLWIGYYAQGRYCFMCPG